MPELIYAFIVPLVFALKYTLEKKILRQINPYTALAFEYTVAGILFVAFTLLFSTLVFPPLSLWPLIVFNCIMGAGVIILFYKAIQHSEVSLPVAIASSYSLFAVVFSVILLGEPFLPKYYLAIPLVLVSLALLCIRPGEKLEFTNRMVIFALITSIGWGIFYTLDRVVSYSINAFSTTTFMETGVGLGVIAYLILSKKEFSINKPKETVPLLLLTSSCFAVGALSFNLSLVQIGVSLTTLIDAALPALSAILAFFLLGERLTKRQYAGIAIMVLSLVILAA